MRRFGTAVVGLGVGRSHVAAYAALERSHLVAVCDTNPERLAATAEQHGVRGFAEVDELLRDDRVEVVSIATPHPSHASLAIACLRAGRHAIVEKPMAVDAAQADAMIRAADESGRVLGCIFQRRFWPAALQLHEAIEDGRFERLIQGHCSLSWPRGRDYYGRDAWRGRWDTEGGGVMTNQGIHAIDMLCWFMGDVDELWCRWDNLTHPSIEVEDNAVASLRFKSGALGTLHMTTSSRVSETRITVHGSNGASAEVLEQPEGAVGHISLWTIPGEERIAALSYAEHVERGEYIYVGGGDPPPGKWWPGDYRYRQASWPSYHARQLADFLAAIDEGRKPLVDGREGRRAVTVLEALYRSGRTGELVKIA